MSCGSPYPLLDLVCIRGRVYIGVRSLVLQQKWESHPPSVLPQNRDNVWGRERQKWTLMEARYSIHCRNGTVSQPGLRRTRAVHLLLQGTLEASPSITRALCYYCSKSGVRPDPVGFAPPKSRPILCRSHFSDAVFVHGRPID